MSAHLLRVAEGDPEVGEGEAGQGQRVGQALQVTVQLQLHLPNRHRHPHARRRPVFLCGQRCTGRPARLATPRRGRGPIHRLGRRAGGQGGGQRCLLLLPVRLQQRRLLLRQDCLVVVGHPGGALWQLWQLCGGRAGTTESAAWC